MDDDAIANEPIPGQVESRRGGDWPEKRMPVSAQDMLNARLDALEEAILALLDVAALAEGALGLRGQIERAKRRLLASQQGRPPGR